MDYLLLGLYVEFIKKEAQLSLRKADRAPVSEGQQMWMGVSSVPLFGKRGKSAMETLYHSTFANV